MSKFAPPRRLISPLLCCVAVLILCQSTPAELCTLDVYIDGQLEDVWTVSDSDSAW